MENKKLTYEELYEKCKYFMSEYRLLVDTLNNKNKEIERLKKEIKKIQNENKKQI